MVDPTAGWGEMAGHSKEVDVASFEPGIAKAPSVLDVKFRGMGGATTAEQMHTRMAQTLAVIGALHKAGVIIVPGSDTGLVGYGLHREMELYVQAGMTPMEAIQSATIVSARAMKLDADSGTMEVGKRADLILVEGIRWRILAICGGCRRWWRMGGCTMRGSCGRVWGFGRDCS